MQEVKYGNEYKTLDELRQDAIDSIEEELDCLDDDVKLDIGNRWRDENGISTLYVFDEDNVDDVLDGMSPWEIICLEIVCNGWEEYFTWDGYDFNKTEDIWEDISLSELAEAILIGSFDSECGEIEDLIAEYEEAKEFLENLNEDREKAREVLAKFVACDADWRDLYACLDKLVKNDDVWA